MKNVKRFVFLTFFLALSLASVNAQSCVEEYKLYVLSGEYVQAAALKLNLLQEFDLIDLAVIELMNKEELIKFAGENKIKLNVDLERKAILDVVRMNFLSRKKNKKIE